MLFVCITMDTIMKYRIATRLSINGTLLYSVQRRWLGVLWIEDDFFYELDHAKDYMDKSIKKRDFKHEVIVSE